MMNEHLTEAFWQGAETHVASAPGESAEGLAAWMEQTHGRQGWCLFQTSGTEGRQKWVALTKATMLISARAVNAHFAVTASDRWLLALPLALIGISVAALLALIQALLFLPARLLGHRG